MGDLVGELLQEIQKVEAEPEATALAPTAEAMAVTTLIDELQIDMAGLQSRYKQLTIEVRQLGEKERSLFKVVEAQAEDDQRLSRNIKQLGTAHDNAAQIIASHDESIGTHSQQLTLCASQVSAIKTAVKSQAGQIAKLKKDRCTLTQILLAFIAFGLIGTFFTSVMDSIDYGSRLQRIEEYLYR